MNVSFNEIDVLSKRAARGAGFPWGLAEEAGKATRWLVAHGFPGLEILQDILKYNDDRHGEDETPIAIDGVWQAPTGNLCPIVAGAILCDRAAEITVEHDIKFGAMLKPIALAPFVATAARISGGVFELHWDDVTMVIGANEVSLTGACVHLKEHTTGSVCCRRTQQSITAPVKRETDCTADARVWARLNDYAHRTFAPASDASRLAGAGAGLTDND